MAKDFWTKSTLLGLGLGQFLSLMITSTGFASSQLANKEGSLSSPNGITMPCWDLLMWKPIFLTKYRLEKLVGVAMCIAGLVIVVFSDVHSADRTSGSNPLKGDLIIIAGATLYGVSNVSEEFFVKNADRVELMAFLGIFGAIVSTCQIAIFERNELKSIQWSDGAILPFVGFSVAMFLFYSGVPVLRKISGSAMLNLSLLTSDMWAVLIRIFAYHEKVDWLYYMAFAAVALGLIVYSGGDKMDPDKGEAADEEIGLGQPNKKANAPSSNS